MSCAAETLTSLKDDRAEPESVLQSLVDCSPDFASDIGFLAQASGFPAETVHAAIRCATSLCALPDSTHPQACTTKGKWAAMQTSAVNALAAFHRQTPRAVGMEMESLRSQIANKLPANLFRCVVDALANDKAVIRHDSLIRLPSHQPGLCTDESELADRVEVLLAAASFTPPDVKELETKLGVPGGKLAAVLQQMDRAGRVARVADGMYFAPQSLQQARDLLRAHCQTHPGITAAAFRDLLGASRKFSIALLDHFDRTGFTLRVGDVRKLRRG